MTTQIRACVEAFGRLLAKPAIRLDIGQVEIIYSHMGTAISPRGAS